MIRPPERGNVAVDIYTGLKGSNDHNAAFLDAAIVLLVNAGARVWRTNRVHAKTPGVRRTRDRAKGGQAGPDARSARHGVQVQVR